MDPTLRWLLDHALAPLAAVVTGSLAGWAGAVWRFRSHVDLSTAKLERAFADLRGQMLQGVQLEVSHLKSGLADAIERADSRCREIDERLERLRDKSGEWAKEAELAEMLNVVQRWVSEVQRALGRIEGALQGRTRR